MPSVKDFVRMCRSNQNEGYCKTTCPFFYCREDDNCIMYITHYTEEAEKIIDKWVSEHPVKTYKDDFFEKFPKAQKDEDGTPYEICINVLYDTKFLCNEEESCKHCWLEEYKEDENDT